MDGRESAFVENDEEPVLDGGSPWAAAEMTTGGGFERRIEHHDWPETPETPGKFHVFHEWDGSETAERAEGSLPNENRLVAEETPAVPGEKTTDRFKPDEPRMAPVEFAIKRPADDLLVLQRSADGGEMVRGQD